MIKQLVKLNATIAPDFISILSKYDTNMDLQKDSFIVDAKSVMGVLTSFAVGKLPLDIK